MDSLTGKLLVASPLLTDPNFDRTVVYVCAHNEGGAFGLVLNRIMDASVEEHLPAWLDVVSSPSSIFSGGPCEPASAFGLGRLRERGEREGWMELVGEIGIVDLEREPGELAPELRALRLFSGYAGWAEGQLDGEVDADGWFVVDCHPEDLFATDVDQLWKRIVMRQRGRVAMFAHFPQDPTVN